MQTAKKLFETMGATVDKLPSAEQAILKGAQIIHKVGATRMGNSPSDSVTNQWGQTWDCDNLFVMDGGVFASNPHKNCTLTIMTLAMRNATWLLIMTPDELFLTASLCEIIVPREGDVPSAKDLNVMSVLNEWVSAPYAWQQNDRVTIMHALAWIDDEAILRFKRKFSECMPYQQITIVDDIAYVNAQTLPEFVRPAEAFARLRSLILAAFFFGFVVATFMYGLFFYFFYSDLNQPEVFEPDISIGPKKIATAEVLKPNSKEISPTSPQDQVSEYKTTQPDDIKKQLNTKPNRIDYDTAQLSEILPSISSDEGLLGDNIESFLRSSQFDDVLFSLEKKSEEAHQVQENVNFVLYDTIKTYFNHQYR